MKLELQFKRIILAAAVFEKTDGRPGQKQGNQFGGYRSVVPAGEAGGLDQGGSCGGAGWAHSGLVQQPEPQKWMRKPRGCQSLEQRSGA